MTDGETEITLQEMFDGFMCMSPAETCFLADMNDVWRRKYDTIFNSGVTEDVMAEYDAIAERYELSKAHRRSSDRTHLKTVGGGHATIH